MVNLDDLNSLAESAHKLEDFPSAPTALLVYGSVARGRHDHRSDLDLLVVSDDIQAERRIRKDSAWNARKLLTFTCYSWEELRRMRSYGSLFLLHLHLHGRILRSSGGAKEDITQILSRLPAYSRASHDLDGFTTSLNDSRDALSEGGSTPEFELSSIAIVLRHLAVVGAYLAGEPKFGRSDAVAKLSAVTGRSELAQHFDSLYAFRMAFARGEELPEVDSTPSPEWWLEQVNLAIEVMKCRFLGAA